MEAHTCFSDNVDIEQEALTSNTDGEYDKEEVQSDSESDLTIRIQRHSVPLYCLQSRPCTLCLYLLTVLLILASCVAIVVVSLLVVVHYNQTSGFLEAKCSAESIIREEDRRCSCGRGCSSQYPCVRVSVRLSVITDSGQSGGIMTSWTASLADNEMLLHRAVRSHGLFVFK